MQQAKPAYVAGSNFEALWTAVVDNPEDPAVHERFIQFAVLGHQHQAAIERYRAWGAADPAHRALADRHKVSIAMRVAAQLMVNAPRPAVDPKRLRGGALLLGLGVVFGVVGLATWHPLGLLGPVCLLVGAIELRRAKGTS